MHFLIALTLLLATQQLTEQERAFMQMVKSRVLYSVPGEEAVMVRRDIRYSTVDDPRLLADIYVPPAGKRHPVVIFIHGGITSDIPILPKNWGPYISWGRLMAASGFVAVAFNHRLGYPDPHIEEAAADVRQMITWVRSHAAELDADPDRIALAAYSAGGPLLTIAMREQLPYVRALVSYYNFLEGPAGFSPRAAVDAGRPIPPMFIARGGADAIPGLNDTIGRFVASALAHKTAMTLMTHPTGPHGFEFQSDDDRTREIVRATIDFLHQHLDAPVADDLLAVESARRDAIAKKDFTRLETIYAPDFTAVFGNGLPMDRAGLFNVFRSDDGALVFTTDELHVRRLGESAAIVTGRLTGRAGDRIVTQQRFSHVYEKRAGAWVIVAAEGTPVREPKD